jgi:hypothetical protein
MWRSVVALCAIIPSVAVAEKTKAPDGCTASALRLGTAKQLDSLKLPAGCETQGSAAGTGMLETEAALRERLACKDPKAKLGVDFKKTAVVATAVSYSPAQIGLLVYDDGKTVTFVSMQRRPCKNEPRPMPGPSRTFLFPATKGARTFAHAACTVDTKCN